MIVALVILFSSRQLTHSWCSPKNTLSCFPPTAIIAPSYSPTLSCLCKGACSSQFICPYGTSAGHHGCLHGILGRRGKVHTPIHKGTVKDNPVLCIKKGVKEVLAVGSTWTSFTSFQGKLYQAITRLTVPNFIKQ